MSAQTPALAPTVRIHIPYLSSDILRTRHAPWGLAAWGRRILLVFTSSGDAYSRHSTSLRTASLDKTEHTDGSRRTSAALRQLARYIRSNSTGGEKENSTQEKAYWAALSDRTDDHLECDLCGGKQQWLLVFAKSRELSKPAVDILNALPGYHLKSAQRSRSAVETLRELHQ
ncbi:unnamed protein product, partial [Prorocentrum cordatum]